MPRAPLPGRLDGMERLMKTWKCWIAALALLVSAHGGANDLTDHWWAESESGWGVSAVQQDNMLLLTIFVYGSDRQPTWFTGEARRYGYDMAGNPGFAGPLYRTAGPAHTGPFDPRAVGVTRVGNVTFEARGAGRRDPPVRRGRRHRHQVGHATHVPAQGLERPCTTRRSAPTTSAAGRPSRRRFTTTAAWCTSSTWASPSACRSTAATRCVPTTASIGRKGASGR